MAIRTGKCARCGAEFRFRARYVPKTSRKDGSRPLCRECAQALNAKCRKMGLPTTRISMKAYPSAGETV